MSRSGSYSKCNFREQLEFRFGFSSVQCSPFLNVVSAPTDISLAGCAASSFSMLGVDHNLSTTSIVALSMLSTSETALVMGSSEQRSLQAFEKQHWAGRPTSSSCPLQKFVP